MENYGLALMVCITSTKHLIANRLYLAFVHRVVHAEELNAGQTQQLLNL